jgi:ribosomal protein S18 acetylase RimI-like enzyme
MASVEIRKLTIRDYDSIVKLWKSAGLPYKPKGRDSRENTVRQMEEFPEFYLGAFHENRLVGIVVASYENRMKGWINRLAVDPKYQRHGIAARLIGKAEEALRKRGAKIFCACIEMPNDASAALFKKMGYALHKDILYVTKRESQDV